MKKPIKKTNVELKGAIEKEKLGDSAAEEKNYRLTEQKLKGIEQKIDKALKAIKELKTEQEDDSTD